MFLLVALSGFILYSFFIYTCEFVSDLLEFNTNSEINKCLEGFMSDK